VPVSLLLADLVLQHGFLEAAVAYWIGLDFVDVVFSVV
jgi:hypothetical protein